MHCIQQKTDNRQQAIDNRQQAIDNRQQTTDNTVHIVLHFIWISHLISLLTLLPKTLQWIGDLDWLYCVFQGIYCISTNILDRGSPRNPEESSFFCGRSDDVSANVETKAKVVLTIDQLGCVRAGCLASPLSLSRLYYLLCKVLLWRAWIILQRRKTRQDKTNPNVWTRFSFPIMTFRS